MELMEAMLRRRSIRRYTGEPVPEEKLTCILQSALLAPTSRDFRPCEFYVVQDPAILQELAHCKQAGAEMLAGAGAAIVALADAEKADTWIEDSSIALTYMHLMATDQGLGSCWIQIHLRKTAEDGWAEENVCRILGVSDSRFRVVGILSVGVPAEERPALQLDDLDFDKVHRME